MPLLPTSTSTPTPAPTPNATINAKNDTMHPQPHSSLSSLFSLPLLPLDAIFKLNADFFADTHPLKINVGIGAYRDDVGSPCPLRVVRAVERELAADSRCDVHEYLPIAGCRLLCDASIRLLLGDDSPVLRSGNYCTVQTVSGTGALRIAAELLLLLVSPATTHVYVSDPTWPIHTTLFEHVGFRNVRTYPYYSPATRSLDLDAMLAALRSAPLRSIVLLHACAHNPTGIDPTMDQWRAIRRVLLEREAIVIFDVAYQGFATGDPDADAAALRLFVNGDADANVAPILIAQSYSKNFAIYAQRVGTLTLANAASPQQAEAARSHMLKLTRHLVSNPPAHGAAIVSKILRDPGLCAQWRQELALMVARIRATRLALHTRLVELATPGDWRHVLSQSGMFSYTGLTAPQALEMKHRFHIYMPSTGRINVAGLNDSNLEYFATSFDWVVRNVCEE